MRAIVCDCLTQTMRKLSEIFENGAAPTVYMCNTLLNHNVLRSIVSYFSCNQMIYFTLFCSTWRLIKPQNSSMYIRVSVFLFKQLHLTLTYTHFLSVYTVLTCSVFIWLMKCSSSNCSWHYVYTASHSINLKCVHLAHAISHLKGKLVSKCGCGE